MRHFLISKIFCILYPTTHSRTEYFMSWFSHLRWLLFAFVVLSACSSFPRASPAPTSTPMPTSESPVDAFTMNKRLARTVNMGNALEAPIEGEWGVTIKDEYFQIIHDAGFTA